MEGLDQIGIDSDENVKMGTTLGMILGFLISAACTGAIADENKLTELTNNKINCARVRQELKVIKKGVELTLKSKDKYETFAKHFFPNGLPEGGFTLEYFKDTLPATTDSFVFSYSLLSLLDGVDSISDIRKW